MIHEFLEEYLFTDLRSRSGTVKHVRPLHFLPEHAALIIVGDVSKRKLPVVDGLLLRGLLNQ